MRLSRIRSCILLLCLFGLIPVTRAFAADENAPATGKNFVVQARHGKSIPMRELPTIYIVDPKEMVDHEPFPSPFPLPNPTGRADAVRQVLPTFSGATPTIGANFEGLGTDLGGLGGDPPDSDGAVGSTQYVEFINTRWAVFNKATGAMTAGPSTLSALFASSSDTTLKTGNCAKYDNGDPIVLWDRAAQRWVVTQFAVSGAPVYDECVAISQTADATGAYYLYDFTYTAFNDYPKMGVWSDKYLITYNLFGPTGSSFTGTEVCAFDRTNMLLGNAANQACFTFPYPAGPFVYSLLPSDVDGNTAPPASSQGYFAGLTGLSDLVLYSITGVDYATGALTLNAGQTIPVTAFTQACQSNPGGYRICIPQPSGSGGLTQSLASLGDRAMFRLAYRNFGSYETMVFNHSVDPGGTGSGQTGVRWYELHQPTPNGVPSGSFSVFQSGTLAPSDTLWRWMGSAAMDSYRNIAVAYSTSGSSAAQFPSMSVVTRAPGDALGTLGNETGLFSGSASQLDVTSCGSGCQPWRWGDYTALSIDPTDDCTMWYINQYLSSAALFNWNTRVVSFKIAGCGDTPVAAAMTSPSAGSTLGGTTQTFTWNAGTGVQDYDIWVGTNAGGKDIANIDTFGALSTDVSGLPSNGQGVYVTLWSKIGGTWSQSNRYVYAATGSATPGVMSSPTAGSTLSDPTTFTWTAGTGVTQYSIYVGTTAGAHDIAFVNAGTGTSANNVTIPQNGATVYVTLYSLIAGNYQKQQVQYVAGGAASKATISSPVSGTTLHGGTATFNWSGGSGVTQYTVYVGTTHGAHDVAFVNAGQNTTSGAVTIPTSGTIYVTLYSLINGSYQYTTASYPCAP
ncbi:hypothetical protein Acid345_2149 [Candidatus Koribacter versatilis Ellin345]|uniref:Uncharacterized protein n=1 Tax=Koribacter versatilis (strain Ellin345) TaxID=204669 RepID=Q1IPQ0_KORVE|nr:hypothetical protein [Candidatus Koribacter versatilis]ABF41150.1 hypothetical protein Acid345_2149 [Candidatus Koribacter versatilis Ellin345]